MMTGTVLFFDRRRGFGFAEGADGRRYCLYRKQYGKNYYKEGSTMPGTIVSFEVDESDPRGPFAVNIKMEPINNAAS